MGKTTRLVAALSALLLVIAGVWLLIPKPAATPELQIIDALAEAQDAANHGNVNGVMELVSDDFKAGMLNKARLRLALQRSQQAGRGVRYDVRIQPPRILAATPDKPGQRVVFSSASVLGDGGDTLWGGSQLTLVMRQESRRRWLVFSEPCWRVVAIANLPPIPLDGLGGE